MSVWSKQPNATSSHSGLMTAAQAAKLDSLSAPAKNNLSASAAPTVNDDTSAGYSEGSTWIYSGVTYVCASAASGAAIWVSSADVTFFDTWDLLIAAIAVAGTTYVGKYATVANANGGNGGGTTYTYGGTITNQIVDGGSATYKVIAQGSAYSVTCQPRSVTNPVITSVQSTAVAKPTVAGYYIFTIAPSDSLPTGVSLGDIAYYNGTAWSQFQSYAKAPAGVVVGTTAATQQMYFKMAGSWTTVSDKSSSSYMDIGSVRIQWGNTTSTTITFPVAFKTTAFAWHGSMIITGNDVYSVHLYSVSTTGVTIKKRYVNGSGTVGDVSSGYTVQWMAIGLKP